LHCSLWKLIVLIVLVMAEKCISLVLVIETEKQKFNYVKSGGTAFWLLFFREIVLQGPRGTPLPKRFKPRLATISTIQPTPPGST